MARFSGDVYASLRLGAGQKSGCVCTPLQLPRGSRVMLTILKLKIKNDFRRKKTISIFFITISQFSL